MAENQVFDMKLAIELVQAFHKVSGLGCTLFIPKDNGGVEVIYTEGACKNMCPHFVEVGDVLWRSACQRVHNMAAGFADNFGGRYIYLCGEDHIFFAAPIIADGVLAAALTVGPVHMFGSDEEKQTDPALRPFPVRTAEYVHHLSLMLAASVVSISDSSQTHHRFLNKERMVQQARIHESLSRNKKSLTREYPVAREKELMETIQQADITSTRLILDDILGFLLSSNLVGEDFSLEERIRELSVVVARAALYAGVASGEVFESSSLFLADLDALEGNDAMSLRLQEFTTEMVMAVSRVNEVDNDDVIYRAVEYIRTHYQEKVTLENVASKVGFSPSYFSMIFKKKFGCNFTTYLNEVRIKVSKSALVGSDASIQEIASMVGYDDPSYFTRVFKRMTGVTPGFYRSHRGQVELSKERAAAE